MSSTKLLAVAWVALLALTLLSGVAGAALHGGWLIAAVAALVVIKGQAVIDLFMDLRSAPALLRIAVSIWLAVVAATVVGTAALV